MDFHAIQGNRSTHALATHRGEADETPLQMISNEQLAYYRALERAVTAYAETIGHLLPTASQPGPSADASETAPVGAAPTLRG
jgi:hypothetical protein